MRLDKYQTKMLLLYAQDVSYERMGEKTTVCYIKTIGGYEVVGSSACILPEDYDHDIGKHWALVDALNEIGNGHAFLTHHVQDNSFPSRVLDKISSFLSRERRENKI